MKKALSFLIPLLLLLSLCGCGAPKSYSITYTDVFDTVTTITAFCGSQREFQALADLLHGELLDCHRLFDIYEEYPGMNNLCTVNRCAGREPVAVDERILSLLEFSRSFAAETDNRLNVCAGSLLSLWHDARTLALAHPESAMLPSENDISEAMKHLSPDALVLDFGAGTVFLSDPEAKLDVGSVAKGWAVQRACELAKAAGYTGFLVSAGGNVSTVGTKPGNTPWLIGLEDPFTGGERELVRLFDCSAVTSGSYQRTFTVDGRAYCHIIDPETGFPAERYTMVTVLCPDSALADALSTSLFLLTPEEGQALLDRCGAEALWLYPDGTELRSPGFDSFLS